MRPLTMIAWMTLALPLQAQRTDTLVRNAGAPKHAGTATLIPTLTIGGASATADEYLFDSIKSLWALNDGSVLVIDGRVLKFSLRRYDQSGRFVHNFGRRGDGPGEWQSPDNIGQFSDGRIVLRDALVGRPLTFYKPNGDFDTTWAFKTSTLFDMRVDATDAIWLRMQAGASMTVNSSITTIRLRENGTLIDTVPPAPPFPPMPAANFRVSGDRGSSLINVPYQPRGVGAWSPRGYYATGVSSRYAIDLLLPRTLPNGSTRLWRVGDRVVSIRFKTPAIVISDAERADQTAYMNAQADAFRGTRSGPTPQVPREKPPIRSISFDLDGRIWVRISQPSERYDPPPVQTPAGRSALPALKWREPSVFDVFEPSGQYVGRIATPYDLFLMGRSGGETIQARGDVVWGISRDADGVDSVRRYRINWRSSQ